MTICSISPAAPHARARVPEDDPSGHDIYSDWHSYERSFHCDEQEYGISNRLAFPCELGVGSYYLPYVYTYVKVHQSLGAFSVTIRDWRKSEAFSNTLPFSNMLGIILSTLVLSTLNTTRCQITPRVFQKSWTSYLSSVRGEQWHWSTMMLATTTKD